MPNNISTELREEFLAIVERGDEDAAKKFLVTNLKRFPEDAQDAIISAFVEEAITQKAGDDKAIADFRERGVAMMKELEKSEQLLKLKEKI